MRGDIPVVLGNENPLPVTLSSFTAVQTNDNSVTLNWTTESESSLLGYNIYRNITDEFNNAQKINYDLIEAHNQNVSHTYSYTDNNIEYGREYYYWLQSISQDGESHLYNSIKIKIDDPNAEQLPQISQLEGSYPNPFRPSTKIKFNVGVNNEKGILTIFNLKGELILRKEFEPGYYEFNWQPKNIASGLYFYRLKTQNYISTKKMILLK